MLSSGHRTCGQLKPSMRFSVITAKGLSIASVPSSESWPALPFRVQIVPPSFQTARDSAGITGEFFSITASLWPSVKPALLKAPSKFPTISSRSARVNHLPCHQ